MMLVVDSTLVQTFTFKNQIVSVTTVRLLLFERSPRLPLRCKNTALGVFSDRLTRSMNMV